MTAMQDFFRTPTFFPTSFGAGIERIPFGRSDATCPVRALRAWLDGTKITTGPVFRCVRRGRIARTALSDKSVALVVKRAALAAGLDPAHYAGHSLRAGLAIAES